MPDEPLEIPELSCPFESKISPYADAMHESSMRWAKEQGLFASTASRDVYAKLKIADLAARTHPDYSYDQELLLADWYIWAVLLDDELDQDEYVDSPMDAGRITMRLRPIFRGDRDPQPEEPPLLHALADLSARTKSYLGGAGGPSLNLSRISEAWISEARNNVKNKVPTLETYYRMRVRTVGLPLIDAIVLDAFEADNLPQRLQLRAMTLDDPAELSPTQIAKLQAARDAGRTISHMADAGARMVGFANDIISFPKEHHLGDVNNLVTVLRSHHECRWQEAIDLAFDYYQTEVEEFLHSAQLATDHVQGYDPLLSDSLNTYIDLWRYRLSGTLDWSRGPGASRFEAA